MSDTGTGTTDFTLPFANELAVLNSPIIKELEFSTYAAILFVLAICKEMPIILKLLQELTGKELSSLIKKFTAIGANYLKAEGNLSTNTTSLQHQEEQITKLISMVDLFAEMPENITNVRHELEGLLQSNNPLAKQLAETLAAANEVLAQYCDKMGQFNQQYADILLAKLTDLHTTEKNYLKNTDKISQEKDILVAILEMLAPHIKRQPTRNLRELDESELREILENVLDVKDMAALRLRTTYVLATSFARANLRPPSLQELKKALKEFNKVFDQQRDNIRKEREQALKNAQKISEEVIAVGAQVQTVQMQLDATQKHIDTVVKEMQQPQETKPEELVN